MYIELKDKDLSKKLDEFLERNSIKYFTLLDGENIKYAILYIPNDFKEEIFKEIEDLIEITKIKSAYKFVSREFKKSDTIIDIKRHLIGGDNFILMAGPCSVENKEMLSNIAKEVKKGGAVALRGGAYKPRTSPYDFQGLGEIALKYLREVADENDMLVVTEAMDTENLDLICTYSDIIQIGARNMQNFSLLKKLGKINKPVLLKRGLSATINEFLLSAEYIIAHGNREVILCERGIRTFETMTRNTLDINAIAMIRELSHLPIIVDASHGTGKRSLVEPATLAGIFAGANGAMVEVHENPECALSDGPQSLDFKLFEKLAKNIKKSLIFRKELE
ncbi:3-deoxy-7-phosphoheptulonate synthase [Fusobacterium polymorphum]|uniref:3-deoxy-7-phosphoheptulonate synthase n=1 Tax=Fusobacterium nucleatum subsp. polymorphum TaxID=76857 RepID=A0A246EI36_FUSNP|nr:3-deoxy-7-phosphoheptulonate synthase [Fusobacterium polymorphum]OWP26285.1 3-deoxy-7-phosphoheptulonate synthase [Fusobacterium polymorphum]